MNEQELRAKVAPIVDYLMEMGEPEEGQDGWYWVYDKKMDELMQLITSYVKQRERALLERLEAQKKSATFYDVGKNNEPRDCYGIAIEAIQKERHAILQKPIDAQKVKELAERINEYEEHDGSN